MSFQLTSQAITADDLNQETAGAFLRFEGKVRNHADGREVLSLEYEAYEEMAVNQGNELLAEAIEKFGLCNATAIHRIGMLQVGDTAVVIQVASAHRRACFEACEWIVDQLKWRVPIWKRETFLDGDSGWVAARELPEAEVSPMFERQQRLPQVGPQGQKNLSDSRVLIVGAGGLCAGALPALVGAGIGTIGIIDGDTVDVTNLHRQTIYGYSDIGRLKAERAAVFAEKLHPSIQVVAFPEYITSSNVEKYVSSYDWVIDGCDSLEAKFLLNRVCRKLSKPLVTASVHQFEGQLMTILPNGPCMQCLFPEPPPNTCVGNCAQDGIFGVVPTLFGAIQASEVIKGILGLPVLSHELFLFDMLAQHQTRLKRALRTDCLVCKGVSINDGCDWELSSFHEAARQIGDFDVIDIRDLDEVPPLQIKHRRISIDDCYKETLAHPTVIVCATGRRSYGVAANLRTAGNLNAYSLAGGVAGIGDK